MSEPCDFGDAPVERRGQLTAFGKHVIAAKTFVCAKQFANMRGHFLERGALAIHHVLVEVGRATNRLTGMVDDEIEPIACMEQLGTECVHARSVAKVESEDLETIAPLGEIRLLCV